MRPRYAQNYPFHRLFPPLVFSSPLPRFSPKRHVPAAKWRIRGVKIGARGTTKLKGWGGEETTRGQEGATLFMPEEREMTPRTARATMTTFAAPAAAMGRRGWEGVPVVRVVRCVFSLFPKSCPCCRWANECLQLRGTYGLALQKVWFHRLKRMVSSGERYGFARRNHTCCQPAVRQRVAEAGGRASRLRMFFTLPVCLPDAKGDGTCGRNPRGSRGRTWCRGSSSGRLP